MYIYIYIRHMYAPNKTPTSPSTHFGSATSAAKVRSCTVAECMVLPCTSAAVPIIRARLPEDIARLERRGRAGGIFLRGGGGGGGGGGVWWGGVQSH